MEIDKLVTGILVLVLSALILADGVLTLIDSPILFGGVDGGFKIVIAFIFIILDSQILGKIES